MALARKRLALYVTGAPILLFGVPLVFIFLPLTAALFRGMTWAGCLFGLQRSRAFGCEWFGVHVFLSAWEKPWRKKATSEVTDE